MLFTRFSLTSRRVQLILVLSSVAACRAQGPAQPPDGGAASLDTRAPMGGPPAPGDASSGTPGDASSGTPGDASSGTPGGADSAAAARPLASFDPPGGAFSGKLSVAIKAEAGVRLFVSSDGALPSEASPPYTAPIAVEGARQLRVLAVRGNERQVHSAVYLPVAPELGGWTSNLPVVLLHALAGPVPGPDKYDQSPAALVLLRGAPTRLAGTGEVAARIGWKVRGKTSRLVDQKSWAVELWGAADGDDQAQALLGLPAESDWVLHAPGAIDDALLRNAFAYALANRIGRYAPRTRFVEVFVAGNNEPFTTASYRGVYTLTEKIKPDRARVPIARLGPNDTQAPTITGGYILKVDNNFAPDEPPFVAAGEMFELVEPDHRNITSAQAQYLRGYIEAFVAAVNAPDHVNPNTGKHYRDYIDVDSFVDFHILNLFLKNPDAPRASTYYYKDRNGKLVAGPLWDLDRTVGAADPRSLPPEGWYETDAAEVFDYEWWKPLFEDPAFASRYWQRFGELLDGPFDRAATAALVTSLATDLGAAPARHYAAWPQWAPAGGHAAAIGRMSTWLDARRTWVRANLGKIARP